MRLTSLDGSVNNNSRLLIFKVHARGHDEPLRALLDTGASNNFIRSQKVLSLGLEPERVTPSGSKLIVRLANGSTIDIPKRYVKLYVTCEGFASDESFIVIDLDERFDIILGMPWMTRHRPLIDWDNGSIRSSQQSGMTAEQISAVPSLSTKLAVTVPLEMSAVVAAHQLEDERKISEEVGLANPLDRETDTRDVSVVTANTRWTTSVSGKAREKKVLWVDSPQECVSSTDASLIDVPDQDADTSELSAAVLTETGFANQSIRVDNPPTSGLEITELPAMEHERFMGDLQNGSIQQICHIVTQDGDDREVDVLHLLRESFLGTSSTMDPEVLDERTKVQRFEDQSWDSLKASPYYPILDEFRDVFPEEVPCELPKDKGIRHEIDLVPGTKYCVTRQWPLPREQVEVIDAFFEKRRKAGQVRESKSPHCSPTFCVKKATGGWRIVHAYNKLNDATVPAQTPIPRKDVIIDSMQGSTVFSTIDLTDGFYQIRMRERDIPLTAVSTPSGMLWEWLVMPQGLKNAPATFNRCVTHLLRPVRAFAPSYFDDVYIHSRAENGKTDEEMHQLHLRELLQLMRKHKLYANIKKCLFGVPEIPVLGCFVGKNGVRVDPEKVKVIVEWPIPTNVKELRQFLGLSTYLHKYSKNYADLIVPLSNLLKKDVEWMWTVECQKAFDSVKQSLTDAPVLAIANHHKPFHVVCDASDFAIGSALMQHDDDMVERVISYQSRQLKPAERNYPVHDKELLSMKYALTKFRIYLLGSRPFTVYTDHASLRTAIKSPHLSQRMARWLSFFAEFNFTVEYKIGKLNILADALSRRPDYQQCDQSHCRSVSTLNGVVTRPSSTLIDEIRSAYKSDGSLRLLWDYLSESTDKAWKALPVHYQASLSRYSLVDGLLYYRTGADDDLRIVVPDDEALRQRIVYEYHDAPTGGHFGREKTYVSLSRDFYWNHQYRWVRKYIRSCEICQRVKPSPSAQAPLRSLPVPNDCWKSISMDFIFGLPADANRKTGILVFVDRFSKMVHLAAVASTVSAQQCARIFIDRVFCLHGMPEEIISDRDPRFTARFWRELFRFIGTSLKMSTADHPETDGQTERVNRALEDILRSYAHAFPSWSDFLSMAEFAINNAEHASTGHTPFYLNALRHPRLPIQLSPALSGGETQPKHLTVSDNIDRPEDDLSSKRPQRSFHSSSVVKPTVHPSDRESPIVRPTVQPSDCESPIEKNTVHLSDREKNNISPRLETSHEDRRVPLRRSARLAIKGASETVNVTDVDNNKSDPDVVDNDVEVEKRVEEDASSPTDDLVEGFVLQREAVVRYVRDRIAHSVDKQKEFADRKGRKNMNEFKIGSLVLLSTKTLPAHAINNLGSNKLLPRFIGPFKVLARIGDAYTLDIPRSMRTHPTFYVGRLKKYESSSSFAGSPSLEPPQGRPDSHSPCDAKTQQEPRASHRDPSPVGDISLPELPPSFRDGASRSSLPADAREALASRGSQSSSDSPQYLRRGIPPPLIDSAGNTRWNVDSLVDHRDERRGRSSQRFYRVRWRGFSPTDDTWEPRSALEQDVPDLLKDYEASLPRSPSAGHP